MKHTWIIIFQHMSCLHQLWKIMKVDPHKEKAVVNLNLWIMLRECCSLMLLCSWYWRAGLSSSLCGNRWLFIVFRVISWAWTVFFIHFRQTLHRQKLFWWAGLYMLQPVRQRRIALWESGDMRHDRICLKPAFQCRVMCLSMGVFTNGMTNTLPAFFVTHSTVLRLPSESPVNINHFIFFWLTFMKVFHSVLLHKNDHMTLIWLTQQASP